MPSDSENNEEEFPEPRFLTGSSVLAVENPRNAALRHSSHFWDSTGKTEEAGSSRKHETTRDVFQDASPRVSVVPGYCNPTARDSSPASEGFLLSRS